MTSIAFAVLVGMLVVGVVLFFVGKRGRRLNRNPVCRDCGFDLVGAYPGVVTCPECGSGLKRDGAVRIGVRRRMVSLMFVGVVMVLMAIAPLGIAGYATVTGSNINPSKPTWLLLAEARWASGTQADLIGKELLDRMVVKKILPAGYGPLVEAALARQADRSMSWSDAWGDIVERASVDNVLTATQRAQFQKNAVMLAIETRPRVVRGEPLPLFFKRADQRVSTNANAYAQVWARSVKLDGVPLTRVVPSSRMYPGVTASMARQIRASSAMQPVGYLQLFGSAMGQWSRTYGTTVSTAATVPADAKVGPAVVEVELGYSVDLPATAPQTQTFSVMSAVVRGIASGGSISGGIAASGLGRERVTLRVPVEIVDGAVPAAGGGAPGDARVMVVEPDDMTTAKLAMSLRPGNVNLQAMNYGTIGRQKPTSWLSIQMTMGKEQTMIAHSVAVRVDGKLIPAGEVVSQEHADGSQTYNYSPDSTFRTLTVTLERDVENVPSLIDVVLTPKPELAKLTRSMTKVYGGTIEIKAVAVTVYDPQGIVAKRKTAKEKKEEADAKEKAKDEKSDEKGKEGEGAKEKAGE
ncbi:MAG: cell envelope integrity protein TolA [Phycisphaerales bacterium]|nr:cell envelope integrity protein TolA [Phycisphaerales bacterium]